MTDAEIEQLLAAHKIVANPRARGRSLRGSFQVTYELTSEAGAFQLYTRQNERLANAFSCGLVYLGHRNDLKVTLCRYNGSDHPHANPIEHRGKSFQGFHIHRATERYITAGLKAEHYAEPTDRYKDLAGALAALIQDCNIGGLQVARTTESPQQQLFDDRDDPDRSPPSVIVRGVLSEHNR